MPPRWPGHACTLRRPAAEGRSKRTVAGVDAVAAQVTIAEAAQRLDISTDTVQRRLKRGELAGVKETTPQGFRWLVELPNEAVGTDGAAVDTGAVPPHPLDGSTAEVRRLEEVAQAYREQLDAQRTIFERQITEQAEELAARRREVGELHVLIQGLQRALPAPPLQDQGSAEAALGQPPEQPRGQAVVRRWWHAWR